MPSKIALAYQAIFRPIENRSPFLQFPNSVGGLLGMQFGHTPLIEKLSTTHGVSEVDFPIVSGIHVAKRRRNSPLSHNGMGFAQLRF